MNYTLKVIKNNRIIQGVRTHSLRRFTNSLRTVNWKNSPPKVYLRVSYGKHVNCLGKTVTFYNDGVYGNKRDLWQAFKAFCEKE